MKNFISVLFAFALVVGLSQCKKNVESVQSVPAGVYITLDVDGGDKVIVDPHGAPTYATVTFEQGDVIYVGNNGAYCGYLTYDGTKFGGNIKPTSDDDADFLHFYFMGNKGPTDPTVAPRTVNISDQTERYPVISYGRSTQAYNSGLTSYSARLYNKCAIMRFDVAGVGTNDVVTITGMNNSVYVNFAANNATTTGNPYAYTMKGSGDIRLHNESNGERWAILLPQDEVTAAAASAGGYTHSSAFTVPAVRANGYYNNPVSVAISSYTPGEFTLDANGTKVIFAPGNLQAVFAEANDTLCTWQFAPTQYSYIGDAIANTAVGDNCVTIPGTVDMFGWVGASGTLAPYGINSSKITSDYGNTYNEALKSDWGVAANAANLGGHNNWRTLTIDEWQYLLRDNASDKYAPATVNGVHGMVLLPDIWTLPAGCTFFATFNYTGWTANTYSAQQWALMEANGAVFLPAAGYRGSVGMAQVEDYGHYWSSTPYYTYVYGQNSARSMHFRQDFITKDGVELRFYGLSVRLVRDN